MDEYVEEASQTLQRERKRLTHEERRTLQRLQWMEMVLDGLSKYRLLNVDGIRRRIRSTLVDLPPVLRFRIEGQSFVKRAFFPKVQI
jgi:hypothetical protein